MLIAPFTKEKFLELLSSTNATNNEDADFLYTIYLYVVDGVKDVFKTLDYKFNVINHYLIIFYIVSEFSYGTRKLPRDKIEELKNNEDFAMQLATVCADKYITNEQLKFKPGAFENRFNPPVSSLELYLNFCLNYLNIVHIENKNMNLVKRMLNKGFALSKCILSLITSGFETEAFSTWRTLHEQECILLCLIKNKEVMFNEYFKHVQYSLAYRRLIPNTDEIFVEIKSKMKMHNLKSKDVKKFIEYGYLYSAKNIDKIENFKLNFRNGVEAVAGLSRYAQFYEMSSEIAHSSPLLLFSNKMFFYNITMINLYETFFRLEQIFMILYSAFASKTEFDQYMKLKHVYMKQIAYIYNDLKNRINEQLNQFDVEDTKLEEN